MNVVKFLYSQILALPEKDKEEFARLWEENNKPKQKIKSNSNRIPVPTFEEYSVQVLKILEQRKKRMLKTLSSKCS